MAIAIVPQSSPTVLAGTTTHTSTGSNPLTPAAPNVPDGTLLVAIQSIKGTGTAAAMTAPDDTWELSNAAAGSSTFGFVKTWYKRASNEPSSYSFGKDADGCIVIVPVTGYDSRLGEAIDVLATYAFGSATTSQSAPSITTTQPNTLLITGYSCPAGAVTHSQPTGMTEIADIAVAASAALAVDWVAVAAAGATGTKTSTASSAQNYAAVSIAIAPAPVQVTGLYVPSVTVPHYSVDQNTLIAIVGANSAGGASADDCRISAVTDDAHNLWQEADSEFVTALSADPYVSARCSIWYCAGAAPITQLTVTATQIVDALGVQIMEASGITNVSPVDVTASNHATAASSATASATTTNAADLIVAAAVVGDSGITFSHTADTWTTLTNADTASTVSAKDDLRLRGAYKILSSAAAQSTAWTLSPSGAVAWVALALKGGTVSTTNPNANWPQVVHEIGFGVDPNDPTVTPTWVDVTSRVEEFSTRRGRDYELARTEAGEGDIHLGNADGALDPSNASSPYSPNVRVFTPYRWRATWSGKAYAGFSGYVERWPMKWEDHRGLSKMEVVDGLATLAATRLVGTLGAEILADAPWAYWPLSDGPLANQAANNSTTTSTPLSQAESLNHGGYGTFGATLTLQSEDSVCWQQSRTTTATTDAPNGIYGIALAADMVLPQLSDGIEMECWARIPSTNPSQNYTLLALKGRTFSADALHRIAVLRIESGSGLPTVDVSSSAGAINSFNASASGYADDSWHHYVVHLTTTTVRLWVDGIARVDSTLTSVPSATIDRFAVGGQVDEWSNQNIAAGYFAHVAIFELATADARRIAARSNAGLTGFPEKTGSRMSRLLNYAGWTAGRSIDDGLSFLGTSATISKQTLLQAVQDVAAWENGVVFVDANGNFRFVDRGDRFNQLTKWTFGDGTGEVPYETDVEIDYDPQYVYNDVTITRTTSQAQSGVSTSAGNSAHRRDQASIKSYFTRSLDKQSGVSSIVQCTSEAAWVLENYAQPRMRLANISINPSANPALWPVALGIELGDRVTVKRRPFGSANTIDLDCYIEQIKHQVKPGEWTTVLSLSPVLLTTYGAQVDWQLDASTLDLDTIVG